MNHDLDQIQKVLRDRYSVERELGSGGMATVYLAQDLKHHREVAIKILRQSLVHTIGVDRFLREVEVIARLQHPHVLTLIDSGEIDGVPYYVMPFVKGQSLAEHLAEVGPLSLQEAVRITREIADGLQYAHAAGVIHRDIKPANVLMSEGHAVVSDFGIATALEHATVGRMTETGISLGSPVYMSPEQAAGERDLDRRTDIYSLGCVTYEMLAGAPPVADESMQAILTHKLMGQWPPLREVRPDVPEEIELAVAKAIATKAEDRFPDAASFADALAGGLARAEGSGATRAGRRRLTVVVGAAGVVILALMVGIGLSRSRGERTLWATQQLGRLELLASTSQYTEAFMLAEELSDMIPGDTSLAMLRPEFTEFASVVTDVPGATVYRQMYDDPAAQWTAVGETPLDSLPLPKWASAAMRFRFELEGYEPVYRLPIALTEWARADHEVGDTIFLAKAVGVPEGMVRIPGYSYPDPYPDGPLIQYKDYWIDRNETTNREYKEFVDAGGYTNRGYWVEPLLRGERELTWDDSMAEFRDGTGRPGPSTWQFGTYRDGQENHPVGGMSYYEAAAYARFRGKVLPPSLHWHRATLRISRSTSWIVKPESNLGGDGPWEVGSRRNMNEFGLYDVDGNVREWSANLMNGERFTRGGAWPDPEFQVGWRIPTPAFDRSPTNGIRLMVHLEDDATYAHLAGPVGNNAGRDYRGQKPAGDAEFAIFRRLYDYQSTPLDATVELTGSTEHYDWKKVTFDAAYGGERAGAYIFLPKEGTPPYQPILYWPGSGAMTARVMDHEFISQWTGFIPRSGRALVLPLFNGSYERDDPDFSIVTSGTGNRELNVQWMQDLRRTVEYLVESDEFDGDRIGFYGHSWGGTLGPIAMALEPRIKAAVLDVGGLRVDGTAPAPEFDVFNYAPRVRAPVLMLNGEFDQVFPLDLAQRPLFEILGTPTEDKDHFVFPGGHVVPRGEVITRSLAWYDKYLGVPGG